MLLRTLFVCIACTVVAQTMLQGAASLARTALHRSAVGAADVALTDAAQRAQAAIAAAQMQGSTFTGALPSPQPTCVLAQGASCVLVAQESIVVTTPSPTPCPSGGCAGFVQGNDAVGEGRADATLRANVAELSGEEVATRGAAVVFRTLHVPPYAVTSGAISGVLDDAESGAGDAGGLVPNATSAGTMIDVVYENAMTGAVMPANVWAGFAPSQVQPSGWSP
jgi:hypothetical protein